MVVCVSVVRVWLCFGAVVWFFDAVFGWAFGCQRACGVCSRLLEMADVSAEAELPPNAEADASALHRVGALPSPTAWERGWG